MPRVPPRPCRYPGCPGFCVQGQVFCKDHIMWSSDRMRGSSYSRGYDHRWQKERKLFLVQHPLCAECQRNGRLTPATVVDHIIPHRGDEKLFWDRSNWQPLCKPCHDQKTGSGL